MAAILYTSGSTGLPKGVVLSHRNLVVGGQSVSQYLENSSEDRILSALPLSFDAGLSQVTTAFWVGATVILHKLSLAARSQADLRQGGRHGADCRAAFVVSGERTRLVRRCRRLLALLRQYRRPHAVSVAAASAGHIPERQALSHVWPDRGLSIDLSGPEGSGPTPQFHRQGDP